eukprot:6191457-Pleurochrysis_carterae.AAC.3
MLSSLLASIRYSMCSIAHSDMGLGGGSGGGGGGRGGGCGLMSGSRNGMRVQHSCPSHPPKPSHGYNTAPAMQHPPLPQ